MIDDGVGGILTARISNGGLVVVLVNLVLEGQRKEDDFFFGLDLTSLAAAAVVAPPRSGSLAVVGLGVKLPLGDGRA